MLIIAIIIDNYKNNFLILGEGKDQFMTLMAVLGVLRKILVSILIKQMQFLFEFAL